ncbi:MAG: RDD family protein [Myxococcota bacterium]
MTFVPRPAPLSRRIVAGLIDGACIVVLSGISFVVPLVAWRLVLPMWGVLAVMIGYAVVPVAYFHRTLGLHVMGLNVVRKDGHALDLANALFRELIGRGWFPAAYLLTMLGSVVAARLQVGSTATPPVIAGVMTFLSAGALAVAVIGHFVALGQPDQRTLADLISGSWVVSTPARFSPTDLEEYEDWKAHRRRVIRNVVLFEGLLVLGIFGLPALLSASTGETPTQRAQRLKLESLQAKFERDPASESLAADLQLELQRAGREAELGAVVGRHRQALSLKEADHEARLRAQFAQTRERGVAKALIELLEKQDRLDEARDVYAAWLGEHPEPAALAGFGNWLATNGRTEEAIDALTRATEADPLVPYGHTLLGVSLQRAGRLTLAREHLELALMDEPTDEDAADALRELEEKLGPLPDDGRKALRARFERWKRDAGR